MTNLPGEDGDAAVGLVERAVRYPPWCYPCVKLAAAHNWYAGMYSGLGMRYSHTAASETGAPPKASTLDRCCSRPPSTVRS